MIALAFVAVELCAIASVSVAVLRSLIASASAEEALFPIVLAHVMALEATIVMAPAEVC